MDGQCAKQDLQSGCDYMICGGFNCDPQSTIYKIMTQNGYESCVKKKLGKEQWTFPTETWKYQRSAKGNFELHGPP